MFRILLIIVLILLAIPFINKAQDYLEDKSKKFHKAEKAVLKAFDKDDDEDKK